MRDPVHPRLADVLLWLARAAALTVAGTGLLVLLEWALDVPALTSAGSGLATMKPNTAACFVLAGVSLGLQTTQAGDRRRDIARLLAAVAGLTGLVTLGEHLFGWDLGIDRILLPAASIVGETEAPGRMAPATALSFALSGIALLFLDARPLTFPAQYPALLVALVSLVALVGHAYDVRSLYRVGPFASVALHTAGAFLILSVGLLHARPDRGLLGSVTGGGPGGALLRRLLPAAVLVPFVVGWLSLKGEAAGLYSAHFGVALSATANILIFVMLLVGTARSIERVEVNRRRSEARYRSLMEQANDAILLLDPERRIVEANHQAAELLGRPPAEILGRPYNEMVVPEEGEVTIAGWARLLAEGTIRVEGRRFLRGDGTHVVVDIASAVVQVGEERLVLSILRDITERLRAEAELRATKDRLDYVISANPAVLYTLHLEGAQPTPSWVSANMERLVGYSAQEALTPGWWLAGLHPEDRAAAEAGVRALFDEEHLTHEFRFRHRDGTYHWIRDEQRLLRDAAGAPGEIVGSWSDITERKRAELKLAESEEQFRAVFDGAIDAKVVTDDDGRFLEVNPAACELYGCPRAELLKRKVEEFAEPGFRFEQVLATAGATGRFRASHRLFRPDGTVRDVDASTTINVLPGRHFSALRDMTEHRQLEGQFRQAQKMEAVGQLAGGVAHDFNNLLGVITGYSELLSRRLEPEHAGHKALEQIRKAADRAAALTRQLLAFSRKQVLEPKVLDLNAVLAGVDKMLRRLIGEDVQIQTRFAEDLWQVKADPGQVEQVIVNLAVNARDAMPKGGQLTLETANTALDAAYARAHTYVRPGPYVMLAVSDTGHGMDAGTQSRIFEPFFTTKEPGKGTGLGLATVFGIVKQSGGHINVYSEPGRGSTFKVYLPRIDEVATKEEAATPPPPPPTGTETILLVEDAEALRVMIREILESGGYTVVDASNPDEALARAQAYHGSLHLMLTDVVLPHMSGPDLAASLARVLPEMRVLYMSGYAADAIGNHGVLEPGTFFIQKPFTADDLLRKLRAVLDAPS